MELIATMAIITALVFATFAIIYASGSDRRAEEALKRATQALKELDVVWQTIDPPPGRHRSGDETKEEPDA